MLLSTFDVYDSILLPVLGGVIAGGIVIAIELTFRRVYEWLQRREAEKAMSEFFKQWESKINGSEAISDPQAGIQRTKDVVQYAFHQDYVRQFPVRMGRWSKYLNEKQTEEVSLLVLGYLVAITSLNPPGRTLSQGIYDAFFRRAKEIKWLKI